MRQLLGIDYGSKRVGLALGNDVVRLATPFKTLANTDNLLAELAVICEEHSITDLVIGLPRNANGDLTTQSELARQFGEILTPLKLPIEWQDESLTSVVAEQRVGRGGDIDSEAAVILLQDYLDSL